MKTAVYLNELCKITETLSKCPDPEELLSQILSASLKVSGANEGSLMLVDEKNKSLRVKVGLGLAEEACKGTIRLGEPIAGIVAKSGKPLLLDNRTKGIDHSPLSGRDKGIKSALCLPLKVMERTIGVLSLNITRGKRCFTQKDQELLSVFAAIAAISLEHAGLSSTTEQYLDEMVILNNLGESLGTTFSLEEIFHAAEKTIKEVMETDALCFAFLEQDQLQIKVISHQPLDIPTKEHLKDNILKLISTLTEIEVIEDEKVSFSLELKEPVIDEPAKEIRSQFSLPLVAKNKIIGIIQINSFLPNKFTEGNIRFIATMAPQIAIALENAKIYLTMQELYSGIISALSAELETRNPYTLGHSQRVTTWAAKTANAMKLPEGVPSSLRKVAAKLTEKAFLFEEGGSIFAVHCND